MPGWEGPVHRQVSVDCFLKCISSEHTHQVNYKVSAEHISTDQKGLLQDFLVGFPGLRTLWVRIYLPTIAESSSSPILSHAPELRKLQINQWALFFLIEIHMCENSLKNTSPLLTCWKGFCKCDIPRVRDSNLRPK